MNHSNTKNLGRMNVILTAVKIPTAVMLTLLLAASFFYVESQKIMQVQLKDKLQSTAAAAAMQFDGARVLEINDGDTMETSAALRETALKLQAIREAITNIRFAYIMKRNDNPALLTFVADADLTLTGEQLDINKNGVIDPDEESSQPGDPYDWSEFPIIANEAFLHAAVDDHIATDQWGGTISGYAPIRTKTGEVVGILGIDMAADEYQALTQSIFSPIAFLLIMLAALCIGGGTMLFLWRRKLEQVERLEIERSGLMRLAFHQLGGPLTIISWSLQELEEDGPQSLQRTIANIHEGVRRLSGILKTLKEADMVHAGKIDYKAEFSSLTSVLKDVVNDAGARLAARMQHVRLDLAENITMRLDPALIAGVATELLNNAIDFSPDRSEIVLRSRQEGETAIFEVEDKGCGIPKSDLHRVFDEFTRGSNATKYKADGNGLGLYIVHGIIESTGGNISIKSLEGQGTTVTVRLPIV